MTELLTRTFAARADRAAEVDVEALLENILDGPPSRPHTARLAVAGSVLAVGVVVAGVSTFGPHGDGTRQPAVGRVQQAATQRLGSVAPASRAAAPATSPEADVWLHLNANGTVAAYGPHGLLHPGDAGYVSVRFRIETVTRKPRDDGDFPLTVQGRPARFTDGARPTVTIALDARRQVSIVATEGSAITEDEALELASTLDLRPL